MIRRLVILAVAAAFLFVSVRGGAQASTVHHSPRERDRAIAALSVRVARLEARVWNLRERERADRREIRALMRTP